MAHDALGAHARDELGISAAFSARPIQAALASAASFAVGAAMPLAVTAIAPDAGLIPLVAGTSLLFLALLGGLAARAGGAGVVAGRNTRHVLGCSRHGGDRRRRSIVRNCDWRLKTATVSLIFFNDHEGDVVGLRRALSEFLDGLQELLLERLASRGRLLPDDLQQSLPLRTFPPAGFARP